MSCIIYQWRGDQNMCNKYHLLCNLYHMATTKPRIDTNELE